MFACEIVVLASVIFLSMLFGRSAIFLKTLLEEYCTEGVSSVCKSISALQEHVLKWLAVCMIHIVSWFSNKPD